MQQRLRLTRPSSPATNLGGHAGLGRVLLGVIALVLAALAVVPTAWAGTSFSVGTAVLADTHASEIAVGDLNGDGHLDLAVLTSAGSSIHLFQGNGAGGFTTLGVPIVTANYASDHALGDMDNDGDLDIVYVGNEASFTRASVRVLRNIGGGSFTESANISGIGLNAEPVALGDLNGDRKLDVLVGSGFHHQIWRLFGDGAGGLGAATMILSYDSPSDIALADIDGDNDLDVAVGSGTSDTAILRNTGAGAFTSSTVPYGGSGRDQDAFGGTNHVAFGDLTGDGFPDLVISKRNTGTFAVLMNTAGGTFAAPVERAGFYGATAIRTADWNGDGRLDVAVAGTFNDSKVWVFTGDGAGGLALLATLSPAPNLHEDLEIGDFNGDARTDLVVLRSNPNGAAIPLLNTITNSPPVVTGVTIAPASPTTNGMLTTSPSATDSDGDVITYIYQWQKQVAGSVGFVNLAGETGAALDLAKVGNGDTGDKLRVLVTPSDGQATGAQFTSNAVTVANAPPTATAGGPYAGDEGSAIQLNGSATDPDGPGLATSWSAAPGVGVDAGATCAFAATGATSTTITCTDDGEYTLTLTAHDTVNAPVVANATLTVANVAPTIAAITTPTDGQLFAAPGTVNLAATFADTGADDTHSCAIDWDDGAGAAAGTVDQAANTCGGTRTFPNAGVFTIQMTATDDDGATSAPRTVMIVVYDPSAGFVTGGGWIASPAGACRLTEVCEGAAGKASFGFVSKYQKGSNVPAGNTQFQFQAGGLNFHSTSYDWLVIAGARAQYKGSGTINGTGDYGFLLTAIDGQINGGGGVDKFRIKIWDKTTGKVVYDNQMGSGDDAAPTTAIEGGSIVIHAK